MIFFLPLVYTEWGGPLGTKMVFSMYGSHVSRLLETSFLYLKSTGLCVLGFWLTIYSVRTSFFLVAAEWCQWNERHVLQIYTAASRSHSEAMDRNRAAKFE